MRIPKTTQAAAIAALARLLWRLRPDVVHCHSVRTVDLACYLSRAPVVVSPWGAEIQERGRSGGWPARTIRLVLRRASRVVVTAASMGDELVQRFGVPPARIELLSWGVDYGPFARVDPDEVAATRRELGMPQQAVVLLNNRYFPVVDPALLLGAFERVAARRPDVYLVLVQGFTHERHWQAVVEAAGRREDGRIMLVPGQQPPDEMRRYVQAADILVNIPYRDQLSSSLLEGMAAGVLPIISNLPAYQCLLRDGADLIVLERMDVPSLEQAMVRALDHLAEFRAAGLAPNRALIERSHNWTVQSARMIELYEAVARRRGSD
jgi:glycosyltransferase involved in cell wall biosynthesis